MPVIARRPAVFWGFLLIVASAGGEVLASGSDAADIFGRMRRTWESHKALSARFEQRQDFAGFDEPLLSRGRLRILRPSYFEMSFDPPNRQVQVCDGSFVWTYTEANRQVIKSPLAPEATRAADLLDWTLAGATPLRADADTTFGPGAIRLDLRPGPQIPLQTLSVWVRGDEASLLGYEATDTDGNRTRVRLLDLKPEKRLKPDDFRFRPPDGVEVIEIDPVAR